MSTRSLFSRRTGLLALSACLPLVLAGCAGFVSTAPATNSFGTGAQIAGHIHGGNQAVSGALVRLYAVGNGGYGSDPVLYATTSTLNDGYGSFSFTKLPTNVGNVSSDINTYGCPAVGDPQMYLLATGGNTVGTGTSENSAAAFMAAVGPCSGITSNTIINMNEVTTAGTVIALQQYLNPNTLALGAPSTAQAQLGFANAVAGLVNLVDFPSGSVKMGTAPASSVAGVTMSAVPEYQKINTLANIMSACANNADASGDGCVQLFANAVAPSPSVTSQPGITFNSPTNVISALYYMLTNPTESQDNGPTGKLANLFNLTAAVAPFQPALTAQPLDWTVGIAFTPSGTCTNANNGSFASAAVWAGAVDGSGNFWFVNAATTGTLAAVGPTGSPIDCQIGSLASGRSLSIDAANNIYVLNNSASKPIYRTTMNGTPVLFKTVATPYALTVDGAGDLFYQNLGGMIYKIPSAASAAPLTPGDVQIFANPAGGGATHEYVSVDGGGRVWGTYRTVTQASYQLNIVFPTTDGSALHGYLASNIADVSSGANGYPYNTYGAPAFDHTGNGFLASACCDASANANVIHKVTLNPVAADATSVTATKVTSAQFPGGMVSPRAQTIDGAGNLWIGSSQGVSSTLFALFEVDNNLNPLSPSGTAPSACTSMSAATCFTNGGFQKAGLDITRAIGVDPSGNVWAGTSGGVVYEMVGAAVPVVTPIAAGLANGTAGTKP